MTLNAGSIRVVRALAAAALVGAAIIGPLAPPASADGCNDIEVVFARGTGEPPGIGRVGQAFVDSLRGRVGNRSIGTYGVNYPATYDFLAAADGANDASAFIQNVVNNCPDTKLVLGGYSQGAAIIDVITSVPFPAVGFTNPLPANVPDRVAALAVFGNPTAKVGLPLTSSPLYGTRAIDLCNAGDPVCSGGDSVPAHRDYGPSGLTNQAAAFVAGLL
ncbi:MAG: cutinase family protein [Mycobacterium sp.]|nr:cutinase family protein [Mycobacterium sp.]